MHKTLLNLFNFLSLLLNIIYFYFENKDNYGEKEKYISK